MKNSKYKALQNFIKLKKKNFKLAQKPNKKVHNRKHQQSNIKLKHMCNFMMTVKASNFSLFCFFVI